ncbi:hypothetical protein GZ77_10355 [Endozoicomonas montiporae]|uniref:Uncharacterized protein n=1 Tax=Endozoicomonas montiporae TaxID=1027273 RepID=A0A081N8D1_9GAMM|nr:hypothetical protein [Endozoicomonas montiporae]KEQ14704.1 hypothetical protein GZ77_10355 [Endozoicomonas montiporae]
MKAQYLTGLKTVYVKIMTVIVGNALSALGRFDKQAQEEIQKIPDNYHIAMITSPQGAGFRLKVTDVGLFELVESAPSRAPG